MTVSEADGQPPVRALIRDEAYRAVVEQIVCGALRPGDRLSERTLAAQLGVSRMPIKEAMRRLENEGFVRTTPRQGIVIAMSAQDSVLDAVRVRAVLEGLAASLVARAFAADGGFGDTRERLAAALTEMRRASRARDLERLRAVNTQFHEVVRVGCGNRYIAHMSSAVLAVDSAVRRRALADLSEMRIGVREHVKIGQRILDGDDVGAEASMRAHIIRSGEFVISRLGHDGGAA